MLGNFFLVAERLAASHEGLSSRELVSLLVDRTNFSSSYCIITQNKIYFYKRRIYLDFF
jgi:hypothetical protein